MPKSYGLYVYIRSEANLWTVGFYDRNDKWQPESDHATPDAAADRVHWLNGGDRTNPSLDEALNSGDGTYRP